MKQTILATLLGLSALTTWGTDKLTVIPGPDDTGGMVMPLVYFDMDERSIRIDASQGTTVSMYSLQDYVVWGEQPFSDSVFDPSLSDQDWYDLLDPTRQNLPFSTRYGFEVMSGNASELPADSYVYIKATSISDGLKIYDMGYWADVWQTEDSTGTWLQVFGEGNFGSTLGLDNIAAWGDASTIKMWHPVAIATIAGTLSATFEIYVGDGYANPLEDWSSASVTLNWDVPTVPEPATQFVVMLALFAGVPLAIYRRRKCTSPQPKV